MFKPKFALSCLLISLSAAAFAAQCAAPAPELSSEDKSLQSAKTSQPQAKRVDEEAFSSDLKTAADNFKSRYPKTRVDSFALTPFKGLFEAAVGKEVIYFDKTARFVLSGRLLDMDLGKDLTEARLKDLRRVSFKDLPLEKAVKTVNGSGKRKLVVFTDVDCPFSRRLAQTLYDLKDTTVYTFLFPLESLHPEARGKSDAVWCSPNPQEALDKALKGENLPKDSAKDTCSSPVSDILALAKKLGIAGTPTLINEAGDRTSGALPLDKLEAFVAEGRKAAIAQGERS